MVRTMAKKDEGMSLGWLYVTLGVGAAVGAAYLTWKYVLSDDTKDNLKRTARAVALQGRDMAATATQSAMETGRTVTQGAVSRMRNNSQ